MLSCLNGTDDDYKFMDQFNRDCEDGIYFSDVKNHNGNYMTNFFILSNNENY